MQQQHESASLLIGTRSLARSLEYVPKLHHIELVSIVGSAFVHGDEFPEELRRARVVGVCEQEDVNQVAICSRATREW